MDAIIEQPARAENAERKADSPATHGSSVCLRYVEMCLELSRCAHNECKEVPHDIGLKLGAIASNWIIKDRELQANLKIGEALNVALKNLLDAQDVMSRRWTGAGFETLRDRIKEIVAALAKLKH